MDKIEKFKKIAELANLDNPSTEQVATIFAELIKYIKENNNIVNTKTSELDTKLVGVELSIDSVNQDIATLDSRIQEVESKPEPWVKEDEVEKLIAKKLPPPVEPTDLEPVYQKLEEVEAKIKPFPEQTVPPEVWKELDDIQEQIEKLKKEVKKAGTSKGVQFFGNNGANLLVDGVLKGSPATYINLIGGNDVTLSTNIVGERIDVTINATGGSGSFSVLAVTGTVDDSNVNFTTATAAVIVVVNGASYRDGHGCTISGTNITLDNPVGTGGDIYAISG